MRMVSYLALFENAQPNPSPSWPRGIPSVATATEGWPFGNLRALPSASLPSTLLWDADSSTLLTVPERIRREQSRGVRDGAQRRTVSEVRRERLIVFMLSSVDRGSNSRVCEKREI
jgi:hypothetical protein